MCLETDIHTYHNGLWYKQPLIPGFTSQYFENLSTSQSGPQAYQLAGTEVPSGEIWVINNIMAVNETDYSTSIQLRYRDDPSFTMLRRAYNTNVGEEVVWTGNIILPEGARISAIFDIVTANNTLQLQIVGYKMVLSE